MPSETSTAVKGSSTSKSNESRLLAIANLPETATEETVKEYFQRYGRVLSVKINEQRFAFVGFTDVRAASKAHNAENLLDDQLLRTAFHDGSTTVPKTLLEPATVTPTNTNLSSTETTSLINSVTVESLTNPSQSTAMTNNLSSKTMNGDREKRSSRTHGSPDDNVRHQVVPVKRDSDSSGSKRKATSTNLSKNSNSSHPTVQKPSHRKHEKSSSTSSATSSSDSERSSDGSLSYKNRRRHAPKTHSTLNDSMRKTRVLKLYHLPAKMPRETLRGSIWDLFVDFKKTGRLLTVKIEGENESRFALLTFTKSEDVEKALNFVTSKSISGTRLKAEPFDASTPETEDHEPVKRSIRTDQDTDEYSAKATRTLYIGNLQSEISYNELRETYSAYGDIIELEIKRQTQLQHQLPFAFVQYADIKSVVKAMKAFEPKLARDHSIKLGFGKSQPTNVLWLDDLPATINESALRNAINRLTNLSNEQVLDIYIDDRNSHKSQTAQCLIYFIDTRAAQEAINSIRGKKIEGKRIQVDFASKVFVTRFSDIIEEASHTKIYAGYPVDETYHNETRTLPKRNGTAREIVPDPLPPFDASSARSNPADRWSNLYNNNRMSHKTESRHPSDRRYSKEYSKGTNNSLISIPSIDNGGLVGSSATRRHRLSTSSKDSLSNNFSSGRSAKRTVRSRRNASSTSSSSSRSTSTSSQSSSSSNSVERRSNSHAKHSTNKSARKSSSKPSKSATASANNNKTLKKKSSLNKEVSTKASHRSRVGKSEKDDEPTASNSANGTAQPTADPMILPTLTGDDQIETNRKESSSPAKPSLTIHSSSSPKAPLKNTERVFDWLMQNHHQESNSSIGLDANDDDELISKRKTDEDSLENVSDDPTAKTPPPSQRNNSVSSTNRTLNNLSSSNARLSKNDKSALSSSYRLQPIRVGAKRDDQQTEIPNNETSQHGSSPPPTTTVTTTTTATTTATELAAIPTPISAPPLSVPLTPLTPSIITSQQQPTTPITPTPLSASSSSLPVHKDENEASTAMRRSVKQKNSLSTGQMKIIPLDSQSSNDQLDVRLKSYPPLLNDHTQAIRLPFPQFAFEYFKNFSASSTVLVVLNPKAHLKHSSLGLNNPSTSTSTTASTSTSTSTLTSASSKIEPSIDIMTTLPTLPMNTDDDLSTARIPLDERIRLLDKQMNEMNQGQQKSTTSSSSSTSSASLSPATLLDQQTHKNTSLMANSSVSTVKSVNDLVSPLLSASSSATLNHCIQAARAAINAQPTAKTPLTLPTTNSFSFAVGSVSPLTPTRTLPIPTPPSVTIPSVLMAPTPLPPPPPPPPPPFPTLRRLSDSTSNAIFNDIQAAFAQTQMAAAAKYTSLTFPTTLHPPPPPIPASLISPSLNLNSPTTPTTTNPLVPTLTCPPPPPPPPPPPAPTILTTPTTISSSSLSNRSNVTDLLSPTVSNLPSHSSLSDVNSQSPSTSSAKIIERLGPSAKVKRKPIPPPLVVAISSNSLTTTKDSSVLPSPDANSSTPGNSNAHHSPVTSSSSPTLQHQTSNSSTTGLKSILKQRSLSNSSSVSPTHERQSPTGERKLSTNYVSPLASNESRSTSNAAPTKNRSASIDSTSSTAAAATTTTTTTATATATMKRTPPSTPTTTKKNSTSSLQDNHVLSSDMDDRQDEKKSTWRTPPSKQTESTITKKPILDKIPKKSTVTTTPTTPKPAVTAPTVTAASTPKAVKSTKPNPTTPVVSKTPQVNLDRVDTKGIKTSNNESSAKTTAKPTKLKRTNFIHSDSDTEKKTSSNNNEQKTKKPLGNNETVKRKQQQQQQQQKSTPIKKNPVGKAKTKNSSNVKRQSANEILSSASEIDERKADTTSTHSEQEQETSDDEEKPNKEVMKKSSKLSKKTTEKKRKNAWSSKDLRLTSSMYDRIKKRQRNEQNRQSSVSTSEDHLSDENSDDDDDDNSDRDDDDDDENDDVDNGEEEDYQRKSHRSNHVGSKSHAKKAISDTSDSDDDRLSRKKTKNTTVFDNNIFDDGDSDEKSSKAPPMKKKIEPPAKPITKKPMVKSNNEPTKKEMTTPAKTNVDTSTTKKKVAVTKPMEKKKNVITTPKPISKIIKSTNAAQKRPSTDDPNETTKKMKTNDEKSKVVSKEETVVAATTPTVTRPEPAEIVPAEKPAIVVTSPSKTNESSTTPTVEPATPNTPSKFGIVFTSQRRQSTASASSTSVPPSTSHEEPKNEIEDMDDDAETHPISNTNVSKDEVVHTNSNTLKPPVTLASGLSDDETLNPETMQLSDLIGASRREEPKPTPTRSTTKMATGKGKRAAKQEVTPNKRQQVKANAKNVRTIANEEKEVEAPVVKPVEPTISVVPTESTPAPLLTNSKRLSTNESTPIASPATEKPESKRLRPSTDEPTVTVKVESVQNVSEPPPSVQIKKEVPEPILAASTHVVPVSMPVPTPVVEPKEVIVPVVSEPTSQVTSMETEPLPPASSIITANQSPTSTSHETETAIKAVYSSIQIPTPTISKIPTLDKTTPIIAPISKETLPIVEHQTTPIPTASILPQHVSIKTTLPSTTFNETVEETLSAVNSLLMLNNNPPNPSSDHPALKGTARVTPTISKPVYSVVASFPSPPTTSASTPAPTAPSRPTTISSAPTGAPSTTTTTTTLSTSTTQSTDLMTLVSNIVSSSNLNGDKQSPTIATATPIAVPSTSSASRSHIEEVIDDVAKGGSATTPVVAAAPMRVATPVSTVQTSSIPTTTTMTTMTNATSTTTTTVAATIVPEPITSLTETNVASSAPTSSKATSIPPILRDVMKTPCLTSTTTSTTITAPTNTTTVTSETLNLFDPHRHSTPTSKTAANTITSTTNVSTTVPSSTPVVPVIVRPNVSKTPTSHKRSSTPKTEQPTSIPSTMLHTFPTLMPTDGSLFAATAAHHPNFPFSLFNAMSSNPSNPSVNTPSNLLPGSLLSNSPPLSVRTSSANNPNVSTTSHMMTNPLVNTILPGQQSGMSGNTMHAHEKPRRDVSSKSSTSSSSSNRSTPIQQAVPVPIPLNIPSSSNSTPTNRSSSQQQQQQQQQQQSSLLNSLDPAAAAVLRQQPSPMQPFLGSDPGVPFRNVFSEAAELYGTPSGLYPPPNIAFAAQQMLNAMAIGSSHHPSAAAAALAELYTNQDPFFRMNSAPSELSRDPYNVQWQGNLILKNDQAYVKTQLVAGSPQIARASMNYWNSDSPGSNSSNLQTPSHHNLRISQRMRLEQAQLEGVQKRMQMDSDHCILIAEPNGSTPDEIRIQQNNLKNGVIRYFDEKKAAGIVNVLLPGTSQPAYVVHIFPPCQFASEILQRRAPDTYRCVVQNKIEQIYLLIVITSTVQ